MIDAHKIIETFCNKKRVFDDSDIADPQTEFDEMEASYACKRLSGVNVYELYEKLCKGRYGSQTDVETMLSIKSTSVTYYIAPYLAYFSTLDGSEIIEDETIQFFLYYFLEYFRLNQRISISAEQKELALTVFEHTSDLLARDTQGSTEWKNKLLKDIATSKLLLENQIPNESSGA